MTNSFANLNFFLAKIFRNVNIINQYQYQFRDINEKRDFCD